MLNILRKATDITSKLNRYKRKNERRVTKKEKQQLHKKERKKQN